MKFSNPLLALILTIGIALALTHSTAASSENPNGDKPPLASLSLAEGDVRYSPNHKWLDPTRPWEQAEEGMDIEQGSILATTEGRAEVDLQNGVKLFLAEKSVLIFWQLHTHRHHLQSELALVSGTATIYGQVPDTDSITFGTAAHHLRVQGDTSVRFDSYLDGTAITHLIDGSSLDWLPTEADLSDKRGLFYPVGETTPNPSIQLPARADWDHWTAWRAQHPGTSPPDCTSPLRKLDPACFQAANRWENTQCLSFEVPLNGGCWCPGFACSGGAQEPLLDTRLRKLHTPCTWVRVGKTVGFVPKDPKDHKGQPPVNLKYGLLVPSKEPGKPPERVPVLPSEKITVMSKPPREFRDGLSPEATRVSAPHMFAHTSDESLPRAANAAATHADVGPGPNSGKGGSGETWARPNRVGERSSGGDRGSSSGSNGRGSSGSSTRGSGGHSGDGYSYSGGGSSGGGHSGGGGTSGGGGGGGYSAGGSYGGSGGSSGGGGGVGGGSHGPR